MNSIIEQYRLSGVALQCVPKKGVLSAEAEAFEFGKTCPVPVYVFGGINRDVYRLPRTELSSALAGEAERLMEMGCTGIKMLEGKPDVRKRWEIPDFDDPLWDAYWTFLEDRQVPLLIHVNDPEEFWDISQIGDSAKALGWYYDETYINNEEQYRQILAVLERHRKLRVIFAHFFFLSRQLPRLAEIFGKYPNVRIDLTPGIEMFYNLSEQADAAEKFFVEYQDRICFGTDIGTDCLVSEEAVPLSIKDSEFRINLIRDFLTRKEDYILEVDKDFVMGRSPTVMHGLNLPESILEKIFERNFLDFTSPAK
ncbi:amidohydrolase family protein [Breznakiella homolactica]|uniref:Amidohydrolase family protein n=1 Tax=Breznakiella homolactica TaxID=2798577 RepID=A0A7T7XMK3_9SPIR|nr:amidohydrolase family protein [Breznakiella homolactica]QQO09119.1 amidohydrolase [Breznakiella homolactica]